MHEPRLPTSAIVFRAFICLALIGLGLGIVGALVSTKPDAGRSSEAAPPPRIAAIEIRPMDIPQAVSGYGTARPLESADVPARVAAVIESIGSNFATGARVERGEVLVTLDASDFMKQVAIAEQSIRAIDAQVAMLDAQEKAVRESADLARNDRELAAADLARVEKAVAEGAAQQREADRARQAVIAATRSAVLADDAVAQLAPRRQALVAQRAGEEARLALARLSAERCQVVAPIAGVLQVAELKKGESVVPGAVIARIVDLRAIEIPLRIPASARALAPVGAAVTLVSRGTKVESAGTVVRVAPEDDPDSRTATVFVELRPDGAGGRTAIAPGAFVEARIVEGGSAPRIAVPRRSIRDGQIVVIEDGRVRLRRVSVDFYTTETPAGAPIADADWAVLDDDIPAGTLVVIDGARSLTDGQQVQPLVAAAEKAKG